MNWPELPMYLRREDMPRLPPAWRAGQVKDICSQLHSGTLYDQRTVAPSGNVPVVNQAEEGFHGFHNDAPGVLATRSAPVVTFANHTCAMRLIREPFSCIQNIFPRRGKEGICDTVFFYYAAKGRVRIGDYKGHHPLFREMWLPLPPIELQERIAAILLAYDNLIENNARRIKILEEMAQAIYREWFVHFRFPGHKKVKLVNSPLGPIPEGWSVRKLGEVVELAYGKALKAENRRKGNIPVYGSSGIVGFHDESLVSGPGIIVGRKGNVGTVHWCGGDFFPIDTVFYVQTNIPLRYTYYNLQTQNFISGDAAVPGLSRTQAYSLPILVPAENVLTKSEGLVEGFFAATRNLQERNKKLRETRDMVLPKLISGEVDVSRLDILGGQAS